MRWLVLGCLMTCTAPAWSQNAPVPSNQEPPPAPEVQPPELSFSVPVPYPEEETENATVVLRLLVQADGKVGQVEVAEGDEPFATIAKEHAAQFEFRPALVAGEPRAAYILFRVEFDAPVDEPPVSPPPAPQAADPNELDEAPQTIVVRGRRQPGTTRTMSDAMTRILPGAEGDPLRSIEALPGTVPILASGPFIGLRGASSGMVGYEYDGISVPYLFHLARGTAIVHPWLVESASLYATGGPARLGRAGGGTIEARAAAPTGKNRAYGRLRLTDSALGAEGTFAKGRGAVLLAGRYSYTRPLVSLIAPEFSLNYWDYQGRVSYQVSDHDRVELLSFGAGDRSAQELPDGSQEDLFFASFHRVAVRHVHTKQEGEVRTTLSYGRDRWDARPGLIHPQSHTIGLRMDTLSNLLGQQGGETLQVESGVDGVLRFQKDQYYTDAPQTQARTYYRNDFYMGAYNNWTYSPSEATDVSLGLRANFYFSESSPRKPSAQGASIEPRLSASHAVTKSLRLHTSAGATSQPPSPSQRPPGRMVSVAGGIERGILSDFGAELKLPWLLSLDATIFHNAYFNTLDAEHLLFVRNQVLDTRAQGQAYGLEVLLARMLAPHLRGFVAYTLSRSTRSIGRVTGPSEFDRRHVLDTALAYDFGGGWSFSSRATYYSGIAARMGSVADLAGRIPRAKGYFQLDVQGEKRFKLPQDRFWAITVGMLNATLSSDVNQFDCRSGTCIQETVGPASVPTIGVEGSL